VASWLFSSVVIERCTPVMATSTDLICMSIVDTCDWTSRTPPATVRTRSLMLFTLLAMGRDGWAMRVDS
jgi:hypothetical protein